MNNILKILISTLLILMVSPLYSYQFDFSTKGLKLISQKNGVKIYKNCNGVLIKRYKDKDVAILKSKTTITKWKNGKKYIKTSTGTKIYIDIDGTTKYIFPNGKTIIKSFDGLTPYGLKIDKKSRTFRRKDFYITIEYSAKMSDNQMNRYVTRFYKQLQEDCYNWLYKKNRAAKKIKLVISFCKFNKTGYCKRKNRKNLMVFLIEKDKIIDSITFSEDDIINPKLTFINSKKVLDKLLINRY